MLMMIIETTVDSGLVPEHVEATVPVAGGEVHLHAEDFIPGQIMLDLAALDAGDEGACSITVEEGEVVWDQVVLQ